LRLTNDVEYFSLYFFYLQNAHGGSTVDWESQLQTHNSFIRWLQGASSSTGSEIQSAASLSGSGLETAGTAFGLKDCGNWISRQFWIIFLNEQSVLCYFIYIIVIEFIFLNVIFRSVLKYFQYESSSLQSIILHSLLFTLFILPLHSAELVSPSQQPAESACSCLWYSCHCWPQ
jgi:hypothetical protein